MSTNDFTIKGIYENVNQCPHCTHPALVYDSTGTGTDTETWIVCSYCGWTDKPEGLPYDPLADDEDIPF